MDELTPEEQAVMDGAPWPPRTTTFAANGVWIVEWLRDTDRKTGRELHEWLETVRPGWSVWRPCRTRADVFAALTEVCEAAEVRRVRSLLQIEAHAVGNEGLGHPDTGERIAWGELTGVFQRLNRATACNLVVLIAACEGIGGLIAMAQREGSVAPALAVIGPAESVHEDRLFDASRAFLVGLLEDRGLSLQDLVDRMLVASGGTTFYSEPYTHLIYETLLEQLIQSLRPEERAAQAQRVVERMQRLGQVLQPMSDEHWSQFYSILPDEYQRMWNELFLIDVHSDNARRFGFDVASVVRTIIERLTRSSAI